MAVRVSAYGGFEDERTKHLELIQGVVARLANEAGLVRGVAITVAAAFFGFAAKSTSWRIAAVGPLSVVVFWDLDVCPSAMISPGQVASGNAR